ncbi:hypothetical protein EDB85DRAFT_2142075 [Lactarius pseudohatsudake]|nr:hypothetical protein EDB85DRAFT_2142075 [Lactarius pseudohatsudake]
MNNQPEYKHEATSTSMSVPLLSLPLSMLHPLSPLLSTFLPSPVTSVTEEQPEPESEPMLTSEFSKFGLSPHPLPLPPDQTLARLQVSSLTLSSLCSSEILTLNSTLAALSPNQPLFSLGSLSQLSRPHELESPTPVSAADIVMLSHPELPLSSPGEPIPFLPTSLEVPPNAPISPHLTPLQRLPELKTIGSVSTQLEVTPSPVLPTVPPIPQQVTTAQWLLYLDPQLPEQQEVLLAYEVLSIKPPALTPRPSLFHSLGSLRRTPARFGFALTLVTTALMALLLLNVSPIFPTHLCKFWSKYEDFSNNQNSNFKISKSCNIPAHQPQLRQYTPRTSRFVFDPGGQSSSSRVQVSRLLSPHKDVHKPNDLIIFNPGGGAFMLEPAHEDLATLDKDSQ